MNMFGKTRFWFCYIVRCFDFVFNYKSKVFILQIRITIKFFIIKIYNVTYFLWAEVLYYFKNKVVYVVLTVNLWGTYAKFGINTNICLWIIEKYRKGTPI